MSITVFIFEIFTAICHNFTAILYFLNNFTVISTLDLPLIANFGK